MSDSGSFLLKKVARGDGRRFYDIKRVVEELESLEEGKSWRVSIEQVKSERSLQQNKYLFGVAYELIAQHLGYEKPDFHKQMCKDVFGTRLKKVPRCKDYPEGLKEVPIRTTTTNERGRRSVLGKILFWNFVEYVQRYGAEAGVVIPDPDPTLAKDWGKEEGEEEEQQEEAA